MASKGSVSSFLEDLISFHLGVISSESDEREASLELYNEAIEEFVTDMVAGKVEVPAEEGILVRSLSVLKALTLAQADMHLSQQESESMAGFEKDEPQDDSEKEDFQNLKQKVAKATQILKDTHAAKQKMAKIVSLKVVGSAKRQAVQTPELQNREEMQNEEPAMSPSKQQNEEPAMSPSKKRRISYVEDGKKVVTMPASPSTEKTTGMPELKEFSKLTSSSRNFSLAGRCVFKSSGDETLKGSEPKQLLEFTDRSGGHMLEVVVLGAQHCRKIEEIFYDHCYQFSGGKISVKDDKNSLMV
jgi:hypothetical protein